MASAQEIYAFRSQFPEFKSVKDADIAVALQASAQWVDETVWDPGDYKIAVRLWAAHFLNLQQMQLATADIVGAGLTDLFVRQISFGERRVGFGQRSTGAKEASLGPGEQLLQYTIYGMQYLMLRSRNVIAVAVV